MHPPDTETPLCRFSVYPGCHVLHSFGALDLKMFAKEGSPS